MTNQEYINEHPEKFVDDMEVPDRLYLSHLIYETYQYQIPDPDDETAVEYTRTDAFIEKAVIWISNNCYIPHSTLENFKNYMKGE